MPAKLLILLLAACALSVQAQERPADQPRIDAQAVAVERVTRNWHLRIGVALAESGQPRDLALAALLQELAAGDEQSGAPAAAEWHRRAAAAAGSDVTANALLLMLPEDALAAAVREQAARRWAAAEPDNIAPLLYLDGGVDELLARAAGMRRFDLHMYGQVRWIQAALLRHPPSASEQAVLLEGGAVPLDEFTAISAMGLWAAAAIPPLDPLVEACDGAALQATPGRRGDCGRIARVLLGSSDSNLGRMVGIDLLARAATSASDRAEVQVLQRRMDWQMLEWGRIAAAQPRGGAPQFARLLAGGVGSEPQLVERILAEAGVASDPPAGWQPPRR